MNTLSRGSRPSPTTILTACLGVLLSACGEPPAPPALGEPHRPTGVLVLGFQTARDLQKVVDLRVPDDQSRPHLRVALTRRALIEALQGVDGLMVMEGQPLDRGGFAPEAAGLLGSGLSTRREPTVPRTMPTGWMTGEIILLGWGGSVYPPPTLLILSGLPVVSGDRALLRLRLQDGTGTTLDELFVDLNHAGTGVEPWVALRGIVETVARAGNLEPGDAAQATGFADPARADGSDVRLLRAWYLLRNPEMVRNLPYDPGPGWVDEVQRALRAPEVDADSDLARAVRGVLAAQLAHDLNNDLQDGDARQFVAEYLDPWDLPAWPDSLEARAAAALEALEEGPPDRYFWLRALESEPGSRDPERVRDLTEELGRWPGHVRLWAALHGELAGLGCWGGAAVVSRWMGVRGPIPYYGLRLGDFSGTDPASGEELDLTAGVVPRRYLADAPDWLVRKAEVPGFPRSRPLLPSLPLWDDDPNALDVRGAWLAHRAARGAGRGPDEVSRMLDRWTEAIGPRREEGDERFLSTRSVPDRAELDALFDRYESRIGTWIESRIGTWIGVYARPAPLERAALAAMRGEDDEALRRLQAIHARGALLLEDLEQDPAFDDIRHLPRFVQMIDDRYRLLESERALVERFADRPPRLDHFRQVTRSCLSALDDFG